VQQIEFSLYSAFLHYSFWRQNFWLDRLEKWRSVPTPKSGGLDPISPKITPMVPISKPEDFRSKALKCDDFRGIANCNQPNHIQNIWTLFSRKTWVIL